MAVEHFLAKSRAKLKLAYEWSNYRLTCHSVNCRKLNFDDVLDPFQVRPGMFRLELTTGRIYPNPRLGDLNRKRVQDTIDRLHLDSEGCRKMRRRHYTRFLNGLPASQLREESPFVWYEADRQGLL